jgi:arginine-tRNA-protein transferase
VLWLIEAAQQAAAGHVYLGYWIAGSRKMAYKTRFQSLEALGEGGWFDLQDS